MAFRLTVVPWAAARTVTDGHVPVGFDVDDRWAGALYTVHMLTAYVGSAVLGAAVLASDALPTWLGWTGVVWGLAFAAGLLATRCADRSTRRSGRTSTRARSGWSFSSADAAADET